MVLNCWRREKVMNATVSIDDKLLADARDATGLKETSEILNQALTALIEREAYRTLIALGGSAPDLVAPPRRRAEPV
jgi:Arc/MetJ family transcription regulator